MRLCVGDDWAEDHHDIEVMDEAGRVLVKKRLRAQLREYFPAAVAAFEDLDAPDVLELLGKAPDPARAAKLTRAQVAAVLKHAGRYKIADRTEAILAALRSPQLGQPPALTAA